MPSDFPNTFLRCAVQFNGQRKIEIIIHLSLVSRQVIGYICRFGDKLPEYNRFPSGVISKGDFREDLSRRCSRDGNTDQHSVHFFQDLKITLPPIYFLRYIVDGGIPVPQKNQRRTHLI